LCPYGVTGGLDARGLMMAIKVRRLGGIVDGIVEYCNWRDFHRGQRVHMNRPSPLPFDPAGEVVLVIVAGLLQGHTDVEDVQRSKEPIETPCQ
jgi:hypothetical protein